MESRSGQHSLNSEPPQAALNSFPILSILLILSE